MSLTRIESYHFDPDGRTPNNVLPVVIYRQAVAATDLAQRLEETFWQNGWTNNWQDIILGRDHYHATTHEVLGISRGEVILQLGGSKGKQVHAKTGDVLIIPAGVGHFSVSKLTRYEVVGGYPGGRVWDLIFNEPEQYEAAGRTIRQLPLPGTNPLLGAVGIPGWTASLLPAINATVNVVSP